MLPAARSPIVFVHGLKGSRLEGPGGDERWLSASHVLGARRTCLALPIDWEASPLRQASDGVVATGPLRSVSGLYNIYFGALAWLSDYASRAGRELKAFAYDWRRAQSEASDRLLEALREIKPRAHVVAHSMGGIIALHAARRDPSVFGSILFVGVPFTPGAGMLEDMTFGAPRHASYLDHRALFTCPSLYTFFPVNGNEKPGAPKWGDAEQWVSRKLTVFGREETKEDVELRAKRLEHLRNCLEIARSFRNEIDTPIGLEEASRIPPTAIIAGTGRNTTYVDDVTPDGMPISNTTDGDGRVTKVCATTHPGLPDCRIVYSRAGHMKLVADRDIVLPVLEDLIRRGDERLKTENVCSRAEERAKSPV